MNKYFFFGVVGIALIAFVWFGYGIFPSKSETFGDEVIQETLEENNRQGVSPQEILTGNQEQEQDQKEEVDTYHEVSLPSMMEKEYNGSDLELVRVVRETGLYTEHFITYTSGDLTISGILNIPTGEVPEGGFPVVFTNHGYIDPAVYTNGRGLRREQDYLARERFAVLHSDYRNHAQSDDDPEADVMLRLGYVEDVINAVLAVQNSDIPELSKDRFGMLGHSMGGGIAQSIMVIKPDLVDAYVLYAPVSSDARDSFYRWTAQREETAGRIQELYGLPEESPEFWDDISPRTFFDQVNSPVMIFHGTADESCDISWSREARDLLNNVGVDVELVEYPGEYHEFGSEHADFMKKSVEFFQNNVL
jgi:dipeptidyl aminopeptidase/acylaminoacyl peptidase